MKTTPIVALALLALFSMTRFSLGQVSMGIVQTNHQLVLYWNNPDRGTNAVLQSSTTTFPYGWNTATDAVPFDFASKIALVVSNPPVVRCFRLSLVPPTTDGMALVPAGTFTIGDINDTNADKDAPPTNVYLSAFYIDTNLVTYGLWQSVYSYATGHGYIFSNAGMAKASSQTLQPVNTVDWFDSVEWCNARSQQANLTPVYYSDAGLTQVYTNGETNAVFANWAANGYRLPTEAEWEKAARGGLSAHRFPWGDTVSESQANYWVATNLESFFYDSGPDDMNTEGFNSLGYASGVIYPYTTPVGSFAANGYGLYDMAGNLDEWCWDWYDAQTTDPGSPYAGGSDPRGSASSPVSTFNPSGESRVVRGGSWVDLAYALRCGDRGNTMPSNAADNIGFRCVRIP